jgi:hypothetical protein
VEVLLDPPTFIIEHPCLHKAGVRARCCGGCCFETGAPIRGRRIPLPGELFERGSSSGASKRGAGSAD